MLEEAQRGRVPGLQAHTLAALLAQQPPARTMAPSS